MRRILMLTVMLIILLSCSVKVNEVILVYGTLRVINNSNFEIWLKIDDGGIISLDQNQYSERTWQIAENDTIASLVQYGRVDGIEINIKVDVVGGTISTFEIDDAVGELVIKNNSLSNIDYKLDGANEITLSGGGGSHTWNWNLIQNEQLEVPIEFRMNEESWLNDVITVYAAASYTYIFKYATLRINNASSRDAWYKLNESGDITIIQPDVYYQNWEWYLPGEDNILVNIDYSGFHIFPNSAVITVDTGVQTSFVIQPDGGGIELQNGFVVTDIAEVYLSPSTDQYWGVNDLPEILEDGETAFWTVATGLWDILVVDEYGFEYPPLFDNNIILDETLIFIASGWIKSDKFTNKPKNKEFKDFRETADRTEYQTKRDRSF